MTVSFGPSSDPVTVWENRRALPGLFELAARGRWLAEKIGREAHRPLGCRRRRRHRGGSGDGLTTGDGDGSTAGWARPPGSVRARPQRAVPLGSHPHRPFDLSRRPDPRRVETSRGPLRDPESIPPLRDCPRPVLLSTFHDLGRSNGDPAGQEQRHPRRDHALAHSARHDRRRRRCHRRADRLRHRDLRHLYRVAQAVADPAQATAIRRSQTSGRRPIPMRPPCSATFSSHRFGSSPSPDGSAPWPAPWRSPSPARSRGATVHPSRAASARRCVSGRSERTVSTVSC